MKAVDLVDTAQILACPETDRLYAAYAVGDREPALLTQPTN
jgi:hypothetical protein